ncbi:PREDICTED: uncharacterized protein LOC106323790 [Brassica oleracea var. oleracea]|uniref:uncharacterized protein LOC106323790 n=1 Tax=Brassica oleracea var. oleracea TaxID=109376 RepID=UPI0006A6B39E|nr:PREDICTED: uncharacterized protein LOC106323790 [Brassica oleracea var. oleracea]
MEKLRLLTFDGVSDPSVHVTSFNIAMRRANLSDEEKYTGFCQLFAETLEGVALNWFTGLQENSVSSFHDLSTAFLKNYIMFTRQEATATDLWNLNYANGWSKNKEKKTQKSQARAPQNEERASPERAPVNNVNPEDESTDEERLKNRRRVEVVLSRPDDSSDDEIPPIAPDLRDKLGRKTDSEDLRVLLKRKAAMVSVSKADLRTTLNESKARKVAHTIIAPSPQPQITDLREQINSRAEDLRVKLSQSKRRDLRRCLEKAKRCSSTVPQAENTTSDLRAQLELMKTTHTPLLNVIMGGSPPCGDSVRAVKDYRRQAVTAQKWPSQIEADHQISFSAADTRGISMPHNDPLLVDIGIGECQVTKVLVDTGSSVALVFRDTLDKMGIDLRDMKPSSRTLTGFNGSSEKMIGTIRLPVYAGDVTRTVKFSVIRAKAPYNAILGTPWLHSMKAIPSTYHQCVNFPGKYGTTQTIRGD